jgi:hypothetical protein
MGRQMISIYSKTYYRIENTKYFLSNALDSTKYHVSNVIDSIRYAHDETWLAIALVTTWVLCAIVASVN